MLVELVKDTVPGDNSGLAHAGVEKNRETKALRSLTFLSPSSHLSCFLGILPISHLSSACSLIHFFHILILVLNFPCDFSCLITKFYRAIFSPPWAS